MRLQSFYGKGPHRLLWAGSRTACGKITVSGVPNRQNYCVIFIVYIQFTNVAAGCSIQAGGQRVGDPWSRLTLPPPSKASYLIGKHAVSPRLMRPGREGDHLSPSSAEVKDAWGHTYLRLMALCLSRQRFYLYFRQLQDMHTIRSFFSRMPRIRIPPLSPAR
jgi:hypothetical protein